MDRQNVPFSNVFPIRAAAQFQTPFLPTCVTSFKLDFKAIIIHEHCSQDTLIHEHHAWKNVLLILKQSSSTTLIAQFS